MTLAKSPPLTLEDFLKLPETKPRNEYIDGHVSPKPVPKSRHSRLQGKLIHAINEVSEPEQIAYAFPELRCTLGNGLLFQILPCFSGNGSCLVKTENLWMMFGWLPIE